MMLSVYRRPLPQHLVAFASSEGRLLFREALAAGTLESYFALAEQHHSQADPTMCGLASLVVALNALGIDPGRLWKGPWRWFSEELLDCCVPLERVRRVGITLDELACLARCNGCNAQLQRASRVDAPTLRRLVLASSRSATGPILVAGYSRSALGQTGAGHFSPLAGYHAEHDLVLLLDVARFKYPPHWVPLEALLSAMREIDPATRLSGGLVALERAPSPRNLAFVFDGRGAGWRRVGHFLSVQLAGLLRQHYPYDARATVALALIAAQELIGQISLRETSDPDHQRAVEAMLAELRGTELFALVDALGIVPLPELATALLFLAPPDTWRALSDPLALQLSRLTDLGRLSDALRNDLSVLRRQLAEHDPCRRGLEPSTTRAGRAVH